VSDSTATDASSEGNPGASGDAATGRSDDGEAGGTLSSDEFEKRLEEIKRGNQARVDKLEQRIEALSKERAAASDTDGGTPKTEPAPGLTLEQLRAEMRRQREVDAAAEAIRKEYPNADPAVFARLDEFESSESLRAAAEASHNRTQALIEPAVQAEKDRLKAAYVEKYGDLGPVTPEDTGTGTGDPTYDQLKRMSPDELDEIGDDVIERVARSAGVSA